MFRIHRLLARTGIEATILGTLIGAIIGAILSYLNVPPDGRNIHFIVILMVLYGADLGIIGGIIVGALIDKRLLPWVERSVMTPTDTQGSRHWGLW